MKKTKLFIFLGSSVLAFTAIFATKENNKFFTFPAKSRTSFCFMTATGTLSTPLFTTNKANGTTTVYVGLFTTGHNILCYATVVTASTGTHAVYHP